MARSSHKHPEFWNYIAYAFNKNACPTGFMESITDLEKVSARFMNGTLP
ncbi:MAG: hypothetical protein ACLSUW_00400 [Akkermansia sp.]